MTFRKRPSRCSSGGSSLAGLGRDTSFPTDECSPEHLELADGRRAKRVPCSRRSCDRTIVFYHNGCPGVLVNDILRGKLVQDSQETVMVGPTTVMLQWPGYDSPDIRDVGRITVNSKTIQDLAVKLCSALHYFYKRASEIPPSVEAVAWARFSKICLKDIVLASIHFDAGVWVPDFYILRARM